jgi:hypothetical protein
LKGAGVGGGASDDGGVLHRAGVLERADLTGDRGALLPDGDVDAADLLHAGLPEFLLVDDRVDRDRGLAGLAVADDQLALATADRGHGVDGLEAGLQRLVHRLAGDNVGRLEFQRAAAFVGDLA